MATDGIEAVGARVGRQLQPRDRPVDAVGLVAVLAEEQIGARVDDHVHARRVGRLAQPTHQFGVLLRRAQSLTLLVHGVLDVQPDRAGGQQSVDQPLRRSSP